MKIPDHVCQLGSELLSKPMNIPLMIAHQRVGSARTRALYNPCDHSVRVANIQLAGDEQVKMAVRACMAAKPKWASIDLKERLQIFRRMLNLLNEQHHDVLVAAAMTSTGKTIDAAKRDVIDDCCAVIQTLIELSQQTLGICKKNSLRSVRHLIRNPLNGFVIAIGPAHTVADNVAAALLPVALGNTVIWAPDDTVVYCCAFLMKLFEEAGLAPGVVNLLSGDRSEIVSVACQSPGFSKVHYCGNADGAVDLRKTLIDFGCDGANLVSDIYDNRNNVIFAAPDVEQDIILKSLISSSFIDQGMHRVSTKFAFIPEAVWIKIRTSFVNEATQLIGSDVFTTPASAGALQNRKAFCRHMELERLAEDDAYVRKVSGGYGDASSGYFVDPLVFEVDYRVIDRLPRYQGPMLYVISYSESAFQAVFDRALLNLSKPDYFSLFSNNIDWLVRNSARLHTVARHITLNCTAVPDSGEGGLRHRIHFDAAPWVEPVVIFESLFPTATMKL